MTAALVQSKSATGTSATSLTITLTSPTTAGNCLVVAVGSVESSANPVVSGITLGGSSTGWASGRSQNNNTDTNAEIWTCQNCAGGQTSVVISFTGGSGSSPGTGAWVMEWSGLLTSLAVDKVNGQNAVSSSFSSLSSGLLSQAAEVVIGVVSALGSGSVTITAPGSPWTELGTLNPRTAFAVAAGWQVVSASTAQTYSGTLSAGAAYGAAVVTLKAATSTTWPGVASLTGTGTITAAWAYEGAAALAGTGTLTATGTSQAITGALLSGSGAMTAAGALTYEPAAALSGSGSMSAASVGFGSATLTGVGTLTALQSAEYGATLAGTGNILAGNVVLGFSAALAGAGSLIVARVLGVVTAAAARGAVTTPYAWPGSSQVAVSAPGSSRLYWLGSLGQVTSLTYSFVCPGGADKMSCTVMVPAIYRTQMFNPGWTVQVFRGGHVVWNGKLDEPTPTAQGWNLTATGTGNLGQNFVALYSGTWPSGEPDVSVNAAIARGLPWVNPGIGTPSGAWLGQAVDSGAQTITALLNLVCTRGGLTWYVNSQPGGVLGNDLSVFPLPTAVNRLLVATTPTGRTLGGDINVIFLRYQATADNSTTGAAATYATTVSQNAASVALHGQMETYVDISDAGTISAGTAQTVGNYVLDIYQRASFSGPFTVHYGDLLNAGGAPVDLGTDQAATVCRAILTDYAQGGEVTPQFPVEFLVAQYSYDDIAQTATVTPFQTLNSSLSSLLGLESQILAPITVAS